MTIMSFSFVPAGTYFPKVRAYRQAVLTVLYCYWFRFNSSKFELSEPFESLM